MAVFKLGSIITDVKGSIGGHTFKSSAGGNVVQTKATRSIRSGNATITKLAINRAFQNPSGYNIGQSVAAIAGVWSQLTLIEKASWSAAAASFPHVNKFGAKTKPSGYHCFMTVNLRLLNAGGSTVSTPPSFAAATEYPNFSVTTLTPSSMILDFTASAPSGFTTVIKATRSLSPGVAPSRSQFSSIIWDATLSSGNLNVTTSYKAAFGAAIVGNMVSFWAQYINLTNGSASVPFAIGAIVT